MSFPRVIAEYLRFPLLVRTISDRPKMRKKQDENDQLFFLVFFIRGTSTPSVSYSSLSALSSASAMRAEMVTSVVTHLGILEMTGAVLEVEVRRMERVGRAQES